MAGILLNNGSLTDKAQQLANTIIGETPQKNGLQDEEILLHDFKLHGISPKVGLVAALQLIHTGTKMYRKDNTIFAVKKLDPQTAQIHFFTMDTMANFEALVKEWLDALRQSGCKVIYDTVADQHIAVALQSAGAQVQQSDNPKFKLKALI